MSRGRERAAWERNARLEARIYNAFRAPDVPAKSPSDFNPYAKRKPDTIERLSRADTRAVLKQMI